MDKLLDETRSLELADRIKSKARSAFNNAYKAALEMPGATYVQGFLVAASTAKPLEHAWIEIDECIVDPTLPYLKQPSHDLRYFPAHRLTVKQLKAAIEEAKEDYPDDDPLPIYGTAPYEYYGDVMLGGKEYLEALEAAVRRK